MCMLRKITSVGIALIMCISLVWVSSSTANAYEDGMGESSVMEENNPTCGYCNNYLYIYVNNYSETRPCNDNSGFYCFNLLIYRYTLIKCSFCCITYKDGSDFLGMQHISPAP